MTNLTFCSTKSFCSGTWMPTLNNGAYYTRQYRCVLSVPAIIVSVVKERNHRVDTHTVHRCHSDIDIYDHGQV